MPNAAADRLDLSVLNQEVTRLVDILRRIENPPACQDERPGPARRFRASRALRRDHAASVISGAPPRRPVPPFAASASSGRPPDSRYSTAIRTAMPLVT